MIYCVVPPATAGRVRKALERAVRGEPGVELVVERRAGERRVRGERRRQTGPHVIERRRVGYRDGRRVAERRSPLVPAAAPEGLRRAARHAEVSFYEPLVAPEEFRRDVEAVRAIVRYKLGERDLSELYDRWFDPVYTYLAVTLERGADLEGQVAAVLADALHELGHGATPGPTDVRPWLFGVAYRRVRPRALELARPLTARGESAAETEAADRGLAWLSDDELVLLVGRRPPGERHVLVLRYFVGLTFAEIGTVMGIDPAAAISLHRCAVASLDATLAAAGRGTRMEERHPMERLTHQTPALRQRRRALLAA